MNFFNDNDIKAVKQAFDNENAKKEQEALNKKFHAQIYANNMMETFLLYKEAAKEYPDICRSLGIEPFFVKEEGFFGKTYYLYNLFCGSIEIDNDDEYYDLYSSKTVGVTQNGDLVEFSKTGKKYKTNEGYEDYYTVRSFPEYDLKRQFLDFFICCAHEDGKVELSNLQESKIGLIVQLLLFSFPGSCRELPDDYFTRYCVKCDASNPKSKEEVRESIKKYFIKMVTKMVADSISLDPEDYKDDWTDERRFFGL